MKIVHGPRTSKLMPRTKYRFLHKISTAEEKHRHAREQRNSKTAGAPFCAHGADIHLCEVSLCELWLHSSTCESYMCSCLSPFVLLLVHTSVLLFSFRSCTQEPIFCMCTYERYLTPQKRALLVTMLKFLLHLDGNLQ